MFAAFALHWTHHGGHAAPLSTRDKRKVMPLSLLTIKTMYAYLLCCVQVLIYSLGLYIDQLDDTQVPRIGYD